MPCCKRGPVQKPRAITIKANISTTMEKSRFDNIPLSHFRQAAKAPNSFASFLSFDEAQDLVLKAMDYKAKD